jgi:YibE/F-like protein
MTRRALYRSGLRIGRDHISSTVNTLALAYAGASLPLLMLFTLSSQSLGTVANGEVVAVEIVATLVGSIGLVAAVPVSTALAVLVTSDHTPTTRPRARPRRRHTPTPEAIEPSVSHEPATVESSDLLAPVERDFWT